MSSTLGLTSLLGLMSVTGVVIGLALSVSPASAEHDSVCASAPQKTGPIADVLYSAGGNTYNPAGVYDGVEQAYIKLVVSSEGQIMARGIVRDDVSHTLLVTEGWANAVCNDSGLEFLEVGFRDPRTGESAVAVITLNRTLYGHLATLRIEDYDLAWDEVVFEPARGS
jgi:hypothetical protein